jgi:hypothetical protein
VLNVEKCLLFFRTFGFVFFRIPKSTKSIHNTKSPISECVKILDLRNLSYFFLKELIGRLAGGLEAFIAPPYCS